MSESPTVDSATARLSETGDDALPAEPTVPPPGTAVGRYVVIEELGRGGMGLVLRAYDPRLQREVALKLLRTDRMSERAQARLLREARAMAQLSHPNVVTVHDAEPHEDSVILAMEYVPGTSLATWLQEEARPWSLVLEAFVAAGRGLVAAHAAGLLHRDFKPSNVLIGPAPAQGVIGRVRVTDFGLARASTTQSSAGESDSASGEGPPQGVALELTHAGDVVGTPAFMAPEQHMKAELGPASDQYAFCVALWAALAGKRPFRGTYKEMAKAKVRGPPPFPKGLHVPGRIVEAVARGLAPRARDRWPSMTDLLEVLEARPANPRRRMLLGAGAIAVLLGAAAIGKVALGGGESPCSGARAHLDAAWGDATRTGVREALDGIEAPFVAGVGERVESELDAYADAWVEMHTDACEATSVRREQSAMVLDARMACLRRARLELEAITRLLGEADVEIAARADEILRNLPRLAECADVERLLAAVPPADEREAAAVEEVRVQLAAARAAGTAGKYQKAETIVGEAAAQAEGLEYAPLRTHVALARGLALGELARYAEAKTALVRALELGMQQQQWAEAHEAAVGLIALIGSEQEHYDEGLAYAATARGLLPRLSAQDEAAADVHGAVAGVYYQAGRFAEAEAERREQVRLVHATAGADDPKMASARGALANVLAALGRYEEATTEYRAAIAVNEKTLGLDHPDAASIRSNFAVALADMGRYEEAEKEYRASLTIKEKAFGPTHPRVGATRGNLGVMLYELKRHGEAVEELEASLDIAVAAHGEDSPATLTSRANLAGALHARGRYEEAAAEFRRVLELRLTLSQPKDPAIGTARNNLASVLKTLGRYEEAEEQHRAALALRQEVYGEFHPDVADSRNNLAALLTEMDRAGEAETEHRQALVIRERVLGKEHPKVAQTHNNLAIVLQELDRYEEAEDHHRKALGLRRAALGDDHPTVSSSWNNLGVNLLHQKRDSDAGEALEEAWKIRSRAEVDAEDKAETAYRLAKLLMATDPARARELATQALQVASSAGSRGKKIAELARKLLE